MIDCSVVLKPPASSTSFRSLSGKKVANPTILSGDLIHEAIRVVANLKQEVIMIDDAGNEASSRCSKVLFSSSPPHSVSMTKFVVGATDAASFNCTASRLFSRASLTNSSASRFLPTMATLFFVVGVKTLASFAS
jgi:hypothetical protein